MGGTVWVNLKPYVPPKMRSTFLKQPAERNTHTADVNDTAFTFR